jgi:DNA modification methylase
MTEKVTNEYAIYEGDCLEIMPKMPSESIDIIAYSPPFSNMYTYSSDDRDLSNSNSYEEFLQHYTFVVKETCRLLKAGRVVAIHCMDMPQNGQQGLIDLSSDIIRIHKENGFVYWDRKTVWKDPLMIAIRTRQKALIHGQLVKDSTMCRGVLPDYILIFKKKGENKVPVTHQFGLTRYAGDFELMNEIDKAEYSDLKEKYINYTDDKTNRLSHFIWKRYADCMWEDIRTNEFLSYKDVNDKNDERHLTPTSLDIMDRVITMYSNPNEVLLTPFMGCGTEVYAAVSLGRKGIGIELKQNYFKQSIQNLDIVKSRFESDKQQTLF